MPHTGSITAGARCSKLREFGVVSDRRMKPPDLRRSDVSEPGFKARNLDLDQITNGLIWDNVMGALLPTLAGIQPRSVPKCTNIS
jgi:hypothetical protein